MRTGRFKKKPAVHTLSEWRRFLEGWQESGLSKKQYCQQKGLTLSVFQRWAKIIRESDLNTEQEGPVAPSQSSAFIPLHLVDCAPKDNPEITLEVSLFEGRHLRLQGRLDWQTLLHQITPLLS